MSRLLQRLGTAVFLALACAGAPAQGPAPAEGPDPMRCAVALREAIPQAMQGDPERAIALYQTALAEVDKGLPIDRTSATRVVAGLLHAYERAGRAGEAIAFLESLSMRPALTGPWQAHLCRLYLKRHALDQAEPACLRAEEEEAQRSAAAPWAQTAMLARALALRQSLFEIGATVGDGSSAAFRQADATGNTAFSTPAESFMRTLSPYSSLAQLYFGRADTAALIGLYEGKFARYADRIEHQLEGAQPATGFQPLEDDNARMGALIAALDPQAPQALRAMQASLRLNAVRTRFIASQYNPALLAGSLATRRAKTALYASMVMQRAKPERQALASMAGELIQAKGVLSELLAIRHRHIETSGEWQLIQLYHRAEMAAARGDEAQWKAAALQLDRMNPAWLPARLFDEGASFVARVGARLGNRTLVSVVRYAPFDFAKQAYGAPHYMALRLHGGELLARDIGPADDLDLMVQRYRAELAATQGPAAAPHARALARGLYARILAPVLGEHLPAGDYVADLDGMLNLLPLEALIDAGDRYLVEAASWRYVSSARALLRDAAPAPAGASTALLLVDPAFSAPPSAPEAAGTGQDVGNVLRTAVAARLGRFEPLPETAQEGDMVGRALARMGSKVTVLSGAAADVAALAAARAPRFLHIATHGFHLEDQAPGPQGFMSSEAASGGMAGGIALANGGLFFISQFRTLDLDGTELVVLSACDTGVGSVRAGEGLNSLRQSLELTGARSQVTALWKVPSVATTALMARFYDRLAGGAAKAQAMRQAKLAFMKTHPNPLYWAGFTFSGEE